MKQLRHAFLIKDQKQIRFLNECWFSYQEKNDPKERKSHIQNRGCLDDNQLRKKEIPYHMNKEEKPLSKNGIIIKPKAERNNQKIR